MRNCPNSQSLAMKISLYQQDIQWLDPEANYLKIESVLSSNRDTELLVMPEMCSSGFVTSPDASQLELPEQVIGRLKSLAEKYQTALCGSFAVNDGGTCCNRAYFVTPEGGVWQADKRHLFAPGGEAQDYTPGQSKCIVQWRGIRFLLLVCYDLRFPVWSRYTPDAPYDIVIYVANWPTKRQLAWDTLLVARAIENQAFAIGVNRVGEDPACQYAGGTRAVHPYGHILAECPMGEESVCSFDPDMEKLMEYRLRFSSLVDSDRFVIQDCVS